MRANLEARGATPRDIDAWRLLPEEPNNYSNYFLS
jgi:hypothetical protein